MTTNASVFFFSGFKFRILIFMHNKLLWFRRIVQWRYIVFFRKHSPDTRLCNKQDTHHEYTFTVYYRCHYCGIVSWQLPSSYFPFGCFFARYFLLLRFHSHNVWEIKYLLTFIYVFTFCTKMQLLACVQRDSTDCVCCLDDDISEIKSTFWKVTQSLHRNQNYSISEWRTVCSWTAANVCTRWDISILSI